MSSCQHQQQLRFRWNDHVLHLSKLLAVQRQEEQFCDITLVSEDGYVLKGHQAILSSTSGYFQRVLKDVSPEQHPIVVLQGANHTELACLMEYIYQGVTQVNHQFMESVIDVADMLEIKGLSCMKSNSSLKKLIRTTDIQSPMHSPQCFHPSRSPSPHYSTSPTAASSPVVYASSSKMDSLQEQEGASSIEAEDDCAEGKGPCRVERGMRTQLTSIDYTEHPTSESMTHAEAYCDQTSGIDLSISRGGCSPKEDQQGSTLNDRMFKKRKLMERIEEEVNDPMTDPDWGRISEKKDDLLPPKHKKFNKSTAHCSAQFSESYISETDSSLPDSKDFPTDLKCYKRRRSGKLFNNSDETFLKSLQFDRESFCGSPSRTNNSGYSEAYPSRFCGASPSTREVDDVKPCLFEDFETVPCANHEDDPLREFLFRDEEDGDEFISENSFCVSAPAGTVSQDHGVESNRDLSDDPNYRELSDQDEDSLISSRSSCHDAGNESTCETIFSAIVNRQRLSEASSTETPTTSRYKPYSDSISTSNRDRYKFLNFKRMDCELPSCVSLNLQYKKSLMASYEPKDEFLRNAIKVGRSAQDDHSISEPQPLQIKRPVNCFVLFVKDYVARNKEYTCDEDPENHSPRFLTQASKAWKALSKEEKAPYEQKAKMLRIEHHKKYPHFMYSPMECTTRKRKERKHKLMLKNLFRIHPLEK